MRVNKNNYIYELGVGINHIELICWYVLFGINCMSYANQSADNIKLLCI